MKGEPKDDPELSPTEKIEARRAARKAGLAKDAADQHVKDLEALDAAEIEHGDSRVGHLDYPYVPGLPTMIIMHTPRPEAVKRYRDAVRTKKDGTAPDSTAATIQLAAVCRAYPDADVFAKMVEARPGVDTQAAQLALTLAVAKDTAEGKG